MSIDSDATAFAERRPTTWRNNWRTWLPRTAVAITVAGLVVSDLASKTVRQYWTEHALTAGLVASAATLAVTVLVVDAVTRSRQAKRWEPVAQAAFRELST